MRTKSYGIAIELMQDVKKILSSIDKEVEVRCVDDKHKEMLIQAGKAVGVDLDRVVFSVNRSSK